MSKSRLSTRILCFPICFLLLACNEDLKEAVVSAPSGLILREGPATTYPAISTIPLGSTVVAVDTDGPKDTIAGETAAWHKIRYKEFEGWVFSAYLLEADSPSAQDLKACVRSNGLWQAPFCYDAKLVALTQNYSLHGSCRGLIVRTLKPDGTVYIHGDYVTEPYSIRWTLENGDSLWIREHGGAIRARVENGSVIWEERSAADPSWKRFPSPCALG